jgi:hypothetical protein
MWMLRWKRKGISADHYHIDEQHNTDGGQYQGEVDPRARMCDPAGEQRRVMRASAPFAV